MTLPKIVLTGGPCAGKSTTLVELSQKFGDKLVIVPEAATLLLSSGFPVPGKDVRWSEEWQQSFQEVVAKLQISLEQSYALVAQQKNAKVIICDRGLLDGAAYTPGGRKVFTEKYGINENEALTNYNAVIHLESLATARPELYGKDNNEHRFETLKEAQALEERTRQAWLGHHRHLIIGGRDGLSCSISKVFKEVEEILVAS